MKDILSRRNLVNAAGWGVTALVAAALVASLAAGPETAPPPPQAAEPARDYAMFLTWEIEGGKVVTGSRFASVEDQAAGRPSEEWCYFEKAGAGPAKQSFYMNKDMYGDADFSAAELDGIRALGARPEDVGFWLTHCDWIVKMPAGNGADLIPVTDPARVEAVRMRLIEEEAARKRAVDPGE